MNVADQNLEIVLTLPEFNQILKALGQQPYTDVYRLIDKLHQQAQTGLSEFESGSNPNLRINEKSISEPDKRATQ